MSFILQPWELFLVSGSQCLSCHSFSSVGRRGRIHFIGGIGLPPSTAFADECLDMFAFSCDDPTAVTSGDLSPLPVDRS